jgi:hypothetical protein
VKMHDGFTVPEEKKTAAEEARERLIDAIPHIAIAMQMAKIEVPDGVVQLAVVSKRANGSGRVTATFEGEEFLKDIIAALGFKDMGELVSDSGDSNE